MLRPALPSVEGRSPFLLLHVHPCLPSWTDAMCQAVLGLQRKMDGRLEVLPVS